MDIARPEARRPPSPPARSPDRPLMRPAGRRRLVALPVALCAAVMLAIAVPRLVGTTLSARAEPVLRKLQDQQPVTGDELLTLSRALEAGESWLDDGRLRTDLGLAYMLQAERLPRGDATTAEALDLAVGALQAGLARAPANPYAWARLAYAEALARGWSRLAVSSLRLSIVTAPYEPRLLWSRLRMSFLAWPEMTPEDREMVFQQVRWAWRANPAELARLATDLRQVNVVRAALLRTPDDAAAFESLLKR